MMFLPIYKKFARKSRRPRVQAEAQRGESILKKQAASANALKGMSPSKTLTSWIFSSL
ncbi:MAG: hypothetical protein AAGA01_06540 [Cyanobacteria bacterium P01_E01_bin.43]